MGFKFASHGAGDKLFCGPAVDAGLLGISTGLTNSGNGNIDKAGQFIHEDFSQLQVGWYFSAVPSWSSDPVFQLEHIGEPS